jgi:hypothetical protein
MDEFDEIVANAFTSYEEVVMVSDAQIGAEHDIDREAARIPAYVDVLLQHAQWARYQAFRANPDTNGNPFGMH